MFYYPGAYRLGFCDVIAACLICLLVAALGLAYSAARADRHGVAVQTAAASTSSGRRG